MTPSSEQALKRDLVRSLKANMHEFGITIDAPLLSIQMEGGMLCRTPQTCL